MASWLWIVIVIAVVVVRVDAMAARRRGETVLRQRFGPEYDRTVGAREAQRAAEADLRGRERERARLDIKPLSEASRVRSPRSGTSGSRASWISGPMRPWRPTAFCTV